jgi:hypothetical protein
MMEEIGAKKAQSWPIDMAREYIFGISLFSASSIKRQSHEFTVTFIAPFISAAIKKKKKPSARHQIRHGMHHPIESNIAVALRRPNLSVMGPEKKEKITWVDIKAVATSPTWVTSSPSSSI